MTQNHNNKHIRFVLRGFFLILSFVFFVFTIIHFSYDSSISDYTMSFLTNTIRESLGLEKDTIFLYKDLSMTNGIIVYDLEIFTPDQGFRIAINKLQISTNNHITIQGLKIEKNNFSKFNDKTMFFEMLQKGLSIKKSFDAYDITIIDQHLDSAHYNTDKKNLEIYVDRDFAFKLKLINDRIQLSVRNIPWIPYDAIIYSYFDIYDNKIQGEIFDIKSKLVKEILGNITIDSNGVYISNLNITGNSDEKLKGSISYIYNTQYFNFESNIKKLDHNIITKYWNRNWGQEAYDWYQTNIKNGTLENTLIKYSGSNNIGYKFEASGNILNAKSNLPKTHYTIDNINGKIKIKDSKVFLNEISANIENVNIHNSKCTVSENGRINLQLKTRSSIDDLYSYIFNEKIPTEVQGIAESDLTIILQKGNIAKHGDINLKNVKIQKLLGFKNGNLLLSIKDDNIYLSGSGNIENERVYVNLVDNNIINIKGKIANHKLGIPESIVSTSLDSDLSINYIDNTIYGTFKAQKSELVEQLGWSSGSEEAIEAKIIGNNDFENLYIEKIEIIGQGIDILGKIEITKDYTVIDLEKLKGFNTDLSGIYRCDQNARKCFLKLQGEQFYVNKFFVPTSTKEFKQEIQIKAKKAISSSDTIIHNFKLSHNDLGLKMVGEFDENKHLYINYKHNNELYLHSDDAGKLVDFLGITTSLKNGGLKIYMKKQEDTEKLIGKMLINNFYIKKAPLLAQVLSLASLKGIADSLNGEGISFYKLHSPLEYMDNTLYISESWMQSDSLGISFLGYADIKKQSIELKGEIIPMYFLNKLCAQIPFLGTILSGNNKHGILGITYTLHGHKGVNKVNVNRLSFLTPRVIRKIFNKHINNSELLNFNE